MRGCLACWQLPRRGVLKLGVWPQGALGRGEYNGGMADDAQRAKTLGTWEQTLVAYLDAADAIIRRGALAGVPEPLELDVLEVLDREQCDALHEFLAASRGD